jgi:hypothetical protein
VVLVCEVRNVFVFNSDFVLFYINVNTIDLKNGTSYNQTLFPHKLIRCCESSLGMLLCLYFNKEVSAKALQVVR